MAHRSQSPPPPLPSSHVMPPAGNTATVLTSGSGAGWPESQISWHFNVWFVSTAFWCGAAFALLRAPLGPHIAVRTESGMESTVMGKHTMGTQRRPVVMWVVMGCPISYLTICPPRHRDVCLCPRRRDVFSTHFRGVEGGCGWVALGLYSELTSGCRTLIHCMQPLAVSVKRHCCRKYLLLAACSYTGGVWRKWDGGFSRFILACPFWWVLAALADLAGFLGGVWRAGGRNLADSGGTDSGDSP